MSELNFGKGLYILDESGEKPIRCDDIDLWAHWFEDFTKRLVETILLDKGTILVSTVFLGVDHGTLSSSPVLWETMVFRVRDGKIGQSLECERCTGTREQALAMHAIMVKRMEGFLTLVP